MARNSEAYAGISSSGPLQADMNSDLVQTSTYLLKCANRFFRVLRAEGIFMSTEARQQALQAGLEMNEAWPFINGSGQVQVFSIKLRNEHISGAEEAYAQIAAMTYRAGYKLFRLRPKYHLGIHLAESLQQESALNPRCPLFSFLKCT